jgi:hypothetical protein
MLVIISVTQAQAKMTMPFLANIFKGLLAFVTGTKHTV